MKRFFVIFNLVTAIYLVLPLNVEAAYTLPDFPSCQNPTGTVKADYPIGDHAIVGIEGLQKGADKVFSLESDNYMQCYCPVNGSNGTQTNWLSAGSISKEDQNVLITQGWVYIPNGADWGLQNQPYLAQNISFSCSGGDNGRDAGGSSGNSSGSSSGSSGGSSGGSTGDQGGSVLGISTLADTSSPYTKLQIFLSLLAGLSLVLYGYKIQRENKN